MGKHVLQDVKGFNKRGGEFFMVDPRVINVVEDWNHRMDFTGEEDLILSIVENGVKVPLLVKKTDDGTLELVDGERRLKAVLKAIDHGNDIKSIPVQVAKRGTPVHELYLESFIRNDSKPPTAIEEAMAFTRFVNWNFSIKEISVKVGRSESHIRNRLELNNASPDVKKALESGEISTRVANKIAKEPDIDKQNETLKNKKSEPDPRKRPKPITVFFNDDKVKQQGGKQDVDITFLESVMNDMGFQQRLKDAGFNPVTLKISIEPLKV